MARWTFCSVSNAEYEEKFGFSALLSVVKILEKERENELKVEHVKMVGRRCNQLEYLGPATLSVWETEQRRRLYISYCKAGGEGGRHDRLSAWAAPVTERY